MATELIITGHEDGQLRFWIGQGECSATATVLELRQSKFDLEHVVFAEHLQRK